jgi:hypothetical protein
VGDTVNKEHEGLLVEAIATVLHPHYRDGDAEQVLAAVLAVRVPCPTCGGTREVEYDAAEGTPFSGGSYVGFDPCPDCSDGFLGPLLTSPDQWEQLGEVQDLEWSVRRLLHKSTMCDAVYRRREVSP